MNEDEVLRLMTARESQSVEFKQSLSQGLCRAGTQSLVAFANRDGGRVLFGVTNDGTLKGVTVGETTLEGSSPWFPVKVGVTGQATSSWMSSLLKGS